MENTDTMSEAEIKKYPLLKDTDLLTKSIISFETQPYNCIIIQDEKNHFLGLLTLDTLITSSNLKSSIKKEITKIPILNSLNLNEIIRLFIEKGIDLIPILDKNKKIAKVISIKALAKEIFQTVDMDLNSITESFSSSISISDPINHLFSLIRKYPFDVFPLYSSKNKEEVISAVKIKNLLKVLHDTESDRVGDIKGERKGFSSTIENFTISSLSDCTLNSDSYYSSTDLIKMMIENQSNNLILVDKKYELKGIISLKQMFKYYLDHFVERSTSFVLRILGAPDKDVEMIANKKVNSLLERYHEFFGENSIPEGNVRFKKIEHQSKAGMFSYETEIRVAFGKGKDGIYSVSATDWGAEKSLNKSYNKLSRLISDKRKMAKGYTKDSPRTLS